MIYIYSHHDGMESGKYVCLPLHASDHRLTPPADQQGLGVHAKDDVGRIPLLAGMETRMMANMKPLVEHGADVLSGKKN